MSYVIPLKLDSQRREKFNEVITCISTKIILAASYIPIILLVVSITKIVVFNVNLGREICRLLEYVSIVGFVIMFVDAVDNWLSLKWNDIEGYDKKNTLRKMITKSIINVGIWILNYVIWGIVLL